MEEAEVKVLRRRILAGETSDDLWLPVTAAAEVVGVTRGTMHNRIKANLVGVKPKAGGPQRLCNPADIRKLLTADETITGGQAKPSS